MSWADDVALLQDGAVSEAGFGEPVVFIPNDAPSIQVLGIYRAKGLAVDPQTGIAIETEQPECHVRLADLPRKPRDKKDRLLVRGQDFVVHESRPDGEGMVRMFLHEARVS